MKILNIDVSYFRNHTLHILPIILYVCIKLFFMSNLNLIKLEISTIAHIA